MNALNKILGTRSKEDRKKEMFSQLAIPAIKNNTPGYYNKPAVNNSLEGKQLITVTLDQLRPYEHNPRKTVNPAYEEIKASIKARGLDHSPNITKRPGDDYYIIADGGNTRLQALRELFKETQDPKFWAIDCIFKPWQGEAEDVSAKINLLTGHLAENDVRGELSFIEKALGVRDLKTLYEEKNQTELSHRELAKELSSNGYPISFQLIARMNQCLDDLYPYIPNILLKGLGRPQIEKLLAIKRNALTCWEKYSFQSNITTEFVEVWESVLSPFDSTDEVSLIELQDNLVGKMCEVFNYNVPFETLKLEISLDERKLQKLLEKQAELTKRVEDSQERVQQIAQEQQALAESKANRQKLAQAKKLENATPHFESNQDNNILRDGEIKTDFSEETFPDSGSSLNTPESTSSTYYEDFNYNDSDDIDDETSSADFDSEPDIILQFVPKEDFSDIARQNGLTFAYESETAIHSIWAVRDEHNLKSLYDELNYITLNIASDFCFSELLEIQPESANSELMVFSLAPISSDLTLSTEAEIAYQWINHLATAKDNEAHANISQDIDSLFNGQVSDLLLVRLFRALRLARCINNLINEN